MLKRLFVGLTVLALVLLAGSIGYSVIEGWSLLDAVYMTVITVATVGFTEVHELSAEGRIFTIFLIFSGISALGFSFGTFIDFLMEGHLKGILEERTMARRVGVLTGHHIVAGIGRVGSEVARTLAKEGAPLVVVDRCEECAVRARNEGWLMVQGDATEEPVLLAAGIKKAKSLIAALDEDADNLFLTLTARSLNPDLFIVSRASVESSEEKLVKAGADRVMTPSVIGGRRMAAMVLHPLVLDYLDVVQRGDETKFRLEELELKEGVALVGKSIRDARLYDRFGIFVLAIQEAGGNVNTKPVADTVLQAGDKLILLGTAAELESLLSTL